MPCGVQITVVKSRITPPHSRHQTREHIDPLFETKHEDGHRRISVFSKCKHFFFFKKYIMLVSSGDETSHLSPPFSRRLETWCPAHGHLCTDGKPWSQELRSLFSKHRRPFSLCLPCKPMRTWRPTSVCETLARQTETLTLQTKFILWLFIQKNLVKKRGFSVDH